jgi:hypothetical protein
MVETFVRLTSEDLVVGQTRANLDEWLEEWRWNVKGSYTLLLEQFPVGCTARAADPP